jgi:hypothetical protein
LPYCSVYCIFSSFAYEATQRGCALNLQCGSKRCKPELNHATVVTETCKAGEIKELKTDENIAEDIKKTRYEINIANFRYESQISGTNFNV